MRVSNLTRKKLAAVGVYTGSGGYSEYSEPVFFSANTLPFKGISTDIQEYFDIINDYNKMYVLKKFTPEFTVPNDAPSDAFIDNWYVYDYETGYWYRVEVRVRYSDSQKGLKHNEYIIYFSSDQPPQWSNLRDMYPNGPTPNPSLVNSFENNVTELNIITPLVIDYLEN